MDVTDEVNVVGQVGEYAFATVGTVAGSDDGIVGKPSGGQVQQFDGQLRPRAMIAFGFGGLGVFLLALGQSLAVAIEPHGDGQSEDFGRRPKRMDDEQAQHDPVVSPTDQRFGATGDERVVVHAGAKKRQAAFTAQGVIDGPKQGGARREERGDELSQVHGQDIKVPGGKTEEAMEAAPVSVVEIAAGENDVGDIAMPVREYPPGDDLDKGPTGANCCSRTTNEEVSCIGRLPCCGDLSRLVPGQILPKKQRRSLHQCYL